MFNGRHTPYVCLQLSTEFVSVLSSVKRQTLTKTVFYVVTGRGPFPIDMLRYDCAYPADQESVQAIAYSHHHKALTNERWSVKLASTQAPTLERWKSFGWSVVTPKLRVGQVLALVIVSEQIG